MNKKYLLLFSILIITIFYGCALFSPTMSSFDQQAYSLTTSTKVDVLNMMDSAIYSYQSQIKNIKAVNSELLKLYEYEKNRPKNTATLAQFHVLLDSSKAGTLYIPFLNLWKKKSTLDSSYIAGKRTQISQAFDLISKLEIGKSKK